jgi:hypothetical protein
MALEEWFLFCLTEMLFSFVQMLKCEMLEWVCSRCGKPWAHGKGAVGCGVGCTGGLFVCCVVSCACVGSDLEDCG